jgi:hypothetical protein
MTASKYIITATALSSLLLSVSSSSSSASSGMIKPSISSIVASSRSGLFGVRDELSMSQGWSLAATLRGGSMGKFHVMSWIMYNYDV